MLPQAFRLVNATTLITMYRRELPVAGIVRLFCLMKIKSGISILCLKIKKHSIPKQHRNMYRLNSVLTASNQRF